VRAIRYANQVGAAAVSLVGFDGGLLHREFACSIRVPIEAIPQTKAIHLVVEHLLMSLNRDVLASNEPDAT
jgi:phosphoheptose isomerase